MIGVRRHGQTPFQIHIICTWYYFRTCYQVFGIGVVGLDIKTKNFPVRYGQNNFDNDNDTDNDNDNYCYRAEKTQKTITITITIMEAKTGAKSPYSFFSGGGDINTKTRKYKGIRTCTTLPRMNVFQVLASTYIVYLCTSMICILVPGIYLFLFRYIIL